MNTATQEKRRHRRGRNHTFFAPQFGNIINEIFNAPLHEVVNEGKRKFTYPPTNISKEDGKYLLSIAIPGVAKENVSINIEKNRLTVKSKVEEDKNVKFRLREFNFTNFERSFRLSEDVDTDNISAKFENGILFISIPTVKEAGPVEVTID